MENHKDLISKRFNYNETLASIRLAEINGDFDPLDYHFINLRQIVDANIKEYNKVFGKRTEEYFK